MGRVCVGKGCGCVSVRKLVIGRSMEELRKLKG